MRRYGLLVLLFAPSVAFGSWWWDWLPGPTSGPGAGKGGFWVIDAATEVQEGAKASVCENVLNLQEETAKQKEDHKDATEILAKEIGDPEAGIPLGNVDLVQIDPGTWENRRRMIEQVENSPMRADLLGPERYLRFTLGQEKRFLLYQARLNVLAKTTEKELGWEERVQLGAQLGVLRNQLLLETLQRIQASGEAQTLDRAERARFLRQKIERVRTDQLIMGTDF